MKWVFLLMCLTGCGAVKQKRLDREAAALEETARAQLVKEAADEMAKRAEAERILAAEIEQEQQVTEELSSRLTATVPEFVHMGAALNVVVSGPEGLTWEVPHAPTDVAGQHTVYIEARHKRGMVKVPINYIVYLPDSSPWLPLEVGNQWSYKRVEHSRTRTGTFLFFIPTHSSQTRTLDSDYLTIRVIEERKLPTHTEFLGEVKHRDEVAKVRLIGADGHTRIFDDGKWKMFLKVPKRPVEDAFATEPLKCAIPALGLEDCQCNAWPQGVRYAPSGPVECVTGSKVTKGAQNNDVVSVLSGIVTVGTYIPHTGKTRSKTMVQLRSSRRPAKPSPLDSDPFLRDLAGKRSVSNGHWRYKWDSLVKRSPLHIEAAGILWPIHSHEEARQEDILEALAGNTEASRMLRLAKTEKERLRMNALLEIPEAQDFNTIVYRHRSQLKDPKTAVSLVALAVENHSVTGIRESLYELLSKSEQLGLHQGMAGALDETVRQDALVQIVDKVFTMYRDEESRIRYDLGLPVPAIIGALYAAVRDPDTADLKRNLPYLVRKYEVDAKGTLGLLELAKGANVQETVLTLVEPHLTTEEKKEILQLGAAMTAGEKFRVKAILDIEGYTNLSTRLYTLRHKFTSSKGVAAATTRAMASEGVPLVAMDGLYNALDFRKQQYLHQGLAIALSEEQRNVWFAQMDALHARYDEVSRVKYDLGLPVTPLMAGVFKRLRNPDEKEILSLLPQLLLTAAPTKADVFELLEFFVWAEQKKELLAALGAHMSEEVKDEVYLEFPSYDKDWVAAALWQDASD